MHREIPTGEFISSHHTFDIEKIFINILCVYLKRTGGKCQIINLGCGFDTLYWRLRDVGHMVSNFIELDYPTVTAKKCYQIKRSKVLLEKLNIEGETLDTGEKFYANF